MNNIGFLSKVVPKHQITLSIAWLKKDFMKFNDFKSYRKGDAGKFDKCFFCKRFFMDADVMALAGRQKGGNIALCQQCALNIKDIDQGKKP